MRFSSTKTDAAYSPRPVRLNTHVAVPALTSTHVRRRARRCFRGKPLFFQKSAQARRPPGARIPLTLIVSVLSAAGSLFTCAAAELAIDVQARSNHATTQILVVFRFAIWCLPLPGPATRPARLRSTHKTGKMFRRRDCFLPNQPRTSGGASESLGTPVWKGGPKPVRTSLDKTNVRFILGS